MNVFIFLMGVATIGIFGTLGYFIIDYTQERPFMDYFLNYGLSFSMQIVVGALSGVISGAIAVFVITRSFFAPQFKYYEEKVRNFNINYLGIIFLSLCAGIGEEIFFRAAIQPLIGIWPTSIIFVAIHGYLNPFNWKIFIYGVVMVFIIAGFGYLFIYAGLITAMMAHFVLDVILFSVLLYYRRNRLEANHSSS
jgi:uncharacterized protein